MLSSKLKSWVESHLSRPGKKMKLKNSKKSASSVPSVMSSSAASSLASSHREDRLSVGGACVSRDEEGARGLALPCGVGVSGRRSNAALVIQLQNDMVMNASGWHPHSQLANSPLIAWRQHQSREHLRPSFAQVNSEQSPSSNSGQFPTNGSIVSSSSKATTSSSICTDLQSCSDMTTLTTTSGTICQLSSPESAYSTGCSADISPTSHDDVTLDTPPEPTNKLRAWGHEVEQLTNQRKEVEEATNQRRAWSLDVDHVTSQRQGRVKEEAIDAPSAAMWQNFSPRTRPSIRTNPWIQRNSSPQAVDRAASGASGGNSEHRLTHPFLTVVKETDIVSDGEPVAAPLSPKVTAVRIHPEPLTDGHSVHLERRIAQTSASNQPTPTRQASGDRRWDADDQYSKLIRETEAILSQLENDELLLTAFKIGESAAETLRTLRLDGSSAQAKSLTPAPALTGARLKKARRKSSGHQRRSSRALEFDWTTSSSSDESSDDVIAPRRLQLRNRKSRPPAKSRDGEQDADWLVGRQFWTPMESRRCLPLVDYSDDRPPSPAPADPADYHRRNVQERTESDQSHLSKQKYIDELLAEIWPEDFDCLLSCNSSDVKLKKSRQQQLMQQQRKTTSSCPGSPAIYWRQEQHLDHFLPDEGNQLQHRGLSDADAAYRSFDYCDRHGNRRRKPKKRSVRKTPSAPSGGAAFKSVDATPSNGGKTKEELWNETLMEQQRLESEVAYLRQQLMNTSSSSSAYASGATVDPSTSFHSRN